MKLECFQHSGTFKARGALSATKQITEEDKKFGITAASAVNHAIAAAWAAKVEKLSAKVVMQTSANPFRVSLAETFGAEIIMKEGGVIKSDFCRDPIKPLDLDTKNLLLNFAERYDLLTYKWGK